jgi:hypothetical protein
VAVDAELSDRQIPGQPEAGPDTGTGDGMVRSSGTAASAVTRSSGVERVERVERAEMYDRTRDFFPGLGALNCRKFGHINICCDGTILDSPNAHVPPDSR